MILQGHAYLYSFAKFVKITTINHRNHNNKAREISSNSHIENLQGQNFNYFLCDSDLNIVGQFDLPTR